MKITVLGELITNTKLFQYHRKLKDIATEKRAVVKNGA